MNTHAPVPTVFIVDDDEAVRNSLCLLLKSLKLAAVAYGSAAEFLAAHNPELPGCAVLDVRMPGMSGLELQDRLMERRSPLPIVFITGHGDVPMAVEAMRHGAFEFLQKPFRDQELIDCIQRAVARDLQNRAQLGEREQILARLKTLTSREVEVLGLVTQGKANKVVAADLGISQRTVEVHRAHLMEKMGASSLAQLVRMRMTIDG